MEQLRKALMQAERDKQGLKAMPEPEVAKTATSEGQYEVPASSKALEQYAYTDTRVMSLDDAHLEARRVLNSTTSDEVMQAYKMLRTQVLQKLKLNEWNSLAVVSPGLGNGKTLTAINLAISLAQEVKHSVLLVDFDLRNPGVAQTLGLDLESGVADYLLRDEPIKDVLVNPGIERLVVLGGCEALNHSSEALGSPKMIRLVEELKQRYPDRIVIFDLPPMLLSDDAIAFAPYVDAMLMVIEEAKTTPEDLQLCADMMAGKPLLGSVLNKATQGVA